MTFTRKTLIARISAANDLLNDKYAKRTRWNKAQRTRIGAALVRYTEALDALPIVGHSVVAQRYRDEYKLRSDTGRGNGDALFQFLAEHFLTSKGELLFDAFVAFLEENRVAYAKWKQEGNGWQGRFRMTASNVLRSRIRKGEALTFNGQTLAF